MPITYQISFISSATGSLLTLLSRSSVSYVSSTMSAGSTVNAFVINCSLQVYDVFNASTIVYSSIAVNPLTAAEKTTQLTNLVSSTALAGGIANQKLLSSVVTSSLNFVNCSLAVNCSTLNRNDCSKKSHTCGSCFTGYYGDGGESNGVCLVKNFTKSLISNTCAVSSDCGIICKNV